VARVLVGEPQAGGRLDHVVGLAVPGLGTAGARRLIAAGGVKVDGRRAHKGHHVAAGQTIEIDDAPAANPTSGASGGGPLGPPFVVTADATFVVAWLYVDDAIVAIDKPAGVPSHPLRAGEGGTAANAIAARFPECATASVDPREGGLGHRLDNGTSGVLLAARSRAAWDALRAALRAPTCSKTYLAEVVGAPPDAGVETAPIGRAGRRGGHVRVGAGRQPLPARTEWVVVERRATTTLVRAGLHAGRAHQVRAHLAAAGFPIVGDDVYGVGHVGAGDDVYGLGSVGAGGDVLGGVAPGARLHLHARSIALRHPLTDAPLLIEAPPPAWAILGA
jgi:23S rRNA pseudouridine1911/1915/1917 synthase